MKLCYNHITRLWVTRALRLEKDFILQQEQLSPNYTNLTIVLGGTDDNDSLTSSHSTGTRGHNFQKSTDVWRADQHAISIVFNPFTV